MTRAAHILWLRLRAFLHCWAARVAEEELRVHGRYIEPLARERFEEQRRYHRGQQTLCRARAANLVRPAVPSADVIPFKQPGA